MFVRRASFIALTILFCVSASFATEWRPIDPADLALKQSRTDPSANAQALFREVHVLSEQHGVSYPTNIVTEYVRLKIFTERGKEYGNVQIPYFRTTHVSDVQGRTIHPDGSIVELAKDSIFEKVIERRGNQTKVVSFAMPAVEPGSIIEFKFTKNEGETIMRYRQLEVQSAFPVDQVTFFIKPISNRYISYPVMRFMPFGCQPVRGAVTHDGYEVISVNNVPAFHEEPYSPPEFSVKQWILIYYEENTNTANDKFWSELGKDRYRAYSQELKVNGEMKEMAAQITAGAATDDAKLDKLLTYCRTEIKDVHGDEITTAEIDRAKTNKNTLDTIRQKEGDRNDIRLAFLALAEAAGFDARRADLSNRATFLFGPNMQSAFFLNTFDVAVNLGGKWKFYDVTNTALPAGQLRWEEQGVYALITDPKAPEMIVTPMLSADESSRHRMADLTLSEDGGLEGDVREMFFGNNASVWRERNRHTNDTQREQALRNEMKRRFTDFELINVHITANADPSKPVGITYHLVVPHYAQRTGKRLLLQPNYFAAGFGSRFTEANRYNNVYFDFPWSEADTVDLKLPEGFELDHPDAPAGIDIPPTCKYTVKIFFDKSRSLVQYRRVFNFGDKSLLLFDAKTYPKLKQVFDTVHDSDNHMLTFKAANASPPAQ